jgi:hypothetical protein
MTRKPPPKLYKYQPYNTQTLDNLKNRVLWFSKPANFNDPFDCAIGGFEISEITQNDWQAIFDKYRERAVAKGTRAKVKFDADFSQEGRPNEKFKSATVKSTRNFRPDPKEAEHFRNKRGVACFSEKVDDILMWAHYADGHRGFCIEFDTTYDPFTRAFPVNYSDAFPTLNPKHILVDGQSDPMMAIITNKSTGWSYEKEWRIFRKEGDTEYTVKPEALTGIYFGCEMSYVHIEIIALILRNSPTQLYKTVRSNREFKVSFKAVEYTPHNYNKK